MQFQIPNSGSVGKKEITAFYGLNRTANVNDFQLSDMVNMDCDRFPFLSTRKCRDKVFPVLRDNEGAAEAVQGLEENEGVTALSVEEEETVSAALMRCICKNSDILDDYSVTGITKSGKFVYLGKVLESEVDFKASRRMVLHSPYFVTFPDLNAFTVENNVVKQESLYQLPEPFATDTRSIGVSVKNRNKMRVNKKEILVPLDRSLGDNESGIVGFKTLLVSGDLRIGTRMKLAMRFSRENEVFKDTIPEDVYEVVTNIEVTDDATGEDITPVGLDFSSFFEVHSPKAIPITVSIQFEAYREDGTRFSFVTEEESVFNVPMQGGLNDTKLYDYFQVGCFSAYAIYSNLEISFTTANLVFGASYGGRLFACDNQGVELLYASGVGNGLNFTQGDGSNAGVLLCQDPGKWTAMYVYHNTLYVFKRDAMYRVYSSDGVTFYMERIADIGALSFDGVTVVGDVLYFLSSTGIYAFDGTYPKALPDCLGRTYTDGVLGGDDETLFCSLVYGAEERELVLYHIDKGIFSVHDDFCAEQFLWFGGALYGLGSDGYVYRFEGERKGVSFSFDTKKYFFAFQKKAVNAVRMYFTFEPTGEEDYFEIKVSRNGGEFEPCLPKITSGSVRFVPIRFCKCDEFCVRVTGRGIFTLKGLSLSVYQGGDVKQNR